MAFGTIITCVISTAFMGGEGYSSARPHPATPGSYILRLRPEWPPLDLRDSRLSSACLETGQACMVYTVGASRNSRETLDWLWVVDVLLVLYSLRFTLL